MSDPPSGSVLFVLATVLAFMGTLCVPCATVDQMCSIANCGAGQGPLYALETDGGKREMGEAEWSNVKPPQEAGENCACAHVCHNVSGLRALLAMSVHGGGMFGGADGRRRRGVCGNPENFCSLGVAALLSRTTECCPPAV